MNNPQAHSQGENTLAAGSPRFGSTIAPAHKEVSLVVVDDHRVFTELFSETLQSAGYRVLATSVTLVEGIATIEQLHPDVVVLDRNLPDGDGLAALERIRHSAPATRVLMLTSSNDREVLRAALAAGCDGYVTKSRGITEVLAAVAGIIRGETPVSTDLGPSNQQETECRTPSLTARETEVLNLVRAGMTNREISEKLYLSVNTVRNHVAHILDKLGARSKLEAVAIGRRMGLWRTSPDTD